MAQKAPKVSESTRDERTTYVSNRYPCISDCDLCGNCAMFHGRDPVLAFSDYIEGSAEFDEVLGRYRYR
ncbi:MAG: hypothetical protein ACOYJL_04450 [Tractidigestivibacter sp.]|jgi:hypothetical protein|uniref:hypothetical protein n=1 Tax=Tractidigestivibacter sp. TaxID=2847320 RepID=UPI003D89F371